MSDLDYIKKYWDRLPPCVRWRLYLRVLLWQYRCVVRLCCTVIMGAFVGILVYTLLCETCVILATIAGSLAGMYAAMIHASNTGGRYRRKKNIQDG